MIDRARWVVAFLLRATADVIEDVADVVDPQPWVGGPPLPEYAPPPSSDTAPPFAAHLVADHPPHLD